MLPVEFRKRFNRNFKSARSFPRVEDASDVDLIAVWDASAAVDKQQVKVANSIAFYNRENRKIETILGEGVKVFTPFHARQETQQAVERSLDALETAIRASAKLAEAAKAILREPRPAGKAEPGANQANLQAMVDAAARKALQGQRHVEPAAEKELQSDVDKPKYKLPEDPNNFALVVGIEKYSDVTEALYAERDALAVRDHLLAMGYPQRNIILLTGNKATKTGLMKNIETWLPRNTTENSSVFFYYSGHGAPDVKSGQAFLVPWDGDPQFLEDTAYPIKRLYEKLGALKAKRVIVAMDSCFSGAGGRSVLAKGSRPLVNKAEVLDSIDDKIVAFSAAGGDQISGTMDAEGHGAFTYYLLKGLGGEAGDSAGRVTVKSLYDYLSPKVADAARRQNRDQTPQLTQARGETGSQRLR